MGWAWPEVPAHYPGPDRVNPAALPARLAWARLGQFADMDSRLRTRTSAVHGMANQNGPDMKAAGRLVDALLEASVIGGHTTIGFDARRRLASWGPPVDADLTGKTFVVTGAASGIGRAAALLLAGAGATIRSASRSADRATRAQEQLRNVAANSAVTVDHVDLSRPDQALDWAHRLRREHDHLDGLLHVAGAYFDSHTLTDDGIEANAAIYVIAPFVLTSALSDLLCAADDGRIVTVSSSGAYAARFSVDALEPGPDSYRPLRAYAHAKRAQIALTHAWAARFGDAVSVHAMTPGWCDTPLVRDGLPRFGALFDPVLRSPDQGADTLAWLAARPSADLGTDGLWRDRARRWEHRLPHTLGGDDAVRVRHQLGEDHVTLAAAGVAFFGFASLVPLMAAGIGIYGLVADPSDVIELVDRLEGTVPEAVADMIRQQLESVVAASPGALGIATAIGIAAGIWSGSSGIGHLIEAVDIAYDEDEENDRSFWAKRAMALGFTLGFLALVAASAVVVVVAARAGSGAPALVASIAGWVIVAALAAGGLAVLYRYGPDRRNAQWRWVTPGAAFAVVIWIAVSIGFRFYVANFGSYNETYGSLGTVIVVLFWLYLTALAVIIGAEIDAEIEHQTARDSTVEPERPMGRRDAAMADTLGEAHR